jgi:UDPglucose 6-dehydrogenase
LAARGLRVIGVDADPRKVEAVNQGVAPVFEPGLAELIKVAGERLTATQITGAAVTSAEMTFIVVPTPSEPAGGFSLRHVLPVCEATGRALAAKADFHLVVLTSTVMPGSTGGSVRATLEQASGKRCGQDFGLCYSPEFIALGSVIRDFLNPDFVLIGESDARSGEILAALYAEVCANKPAVARMNFVNAEISKLAVNTYITTKISFANMLARVCERLPEADVDAVTGALGLDSRIGSKYLKGAVSYGGPCFPRDNLALVALARQLGTPSHLAEVTHEFNRLQIEWLAEIVRGHLPEGGRAGILGLTYKPNTDVVEQSVGFLLVQILSSCGVSVVAFDPVGSRNAASALDRKLRLTLTALECIQETDVVVVATPWPAFREVPVEQWIRRGSPRVVIDCWRILSHLQASRDIAYLPLGTGKVEQMQVQKFTA